MAIGWTYLAIAIVLEVAGTISLKYSAGLTRLLPTLATVVLYSGSFALLALAIKTIELSTAYAIWAAVGTALVAVFAIVIFGSPLTWGKAVSLALVIAGVAGLHLSDAAATALGK